MRLHLGKPRLLPQKRHRAFVGFSEPSLDPTHRSHIRIACLYTSRNSRPPRAAVGCRARSHKNAPSPPNLSRSSKSLGQLLIHMPTVADGHQPNDACFLIDGIDDTKTTNAIFSDPIKFALERLSTCRIGGNGPNGRLDRSFQIRMERADHFRDMRRDIRTERVHAVRRFFMGARGSPNTSSNDSPLRLLL